MAPRRGVSSRHHRRSNASDAETEYGSDNDVLLAKFLDDIQARREEVASLIGNSFAEDAPNANSESQLLEESASAIPIQYVDVLDDTFTVPKEGSPGRSRPATEHPSDKEDARTPLQRFRTAPKKPLSVTDIVSPAWCELQYWYSLTKHGKVKKTPAMKRGSSVHKVLEEQVHKAVPVEIQTREDHWGMTREFEVWGTIDDQVINGVIDELSYTCSDPDLEAKLEAAHTGSKSSSKAEPNPKQASISEFFHSRKTAISSQQPPTHVPDNTKNRKIYLADVKTRGSPRVPAGPSLRPTHMQLMLYRQLLASMASGAVDLSVIFARYKLDPDREFSDSLIRQLSSLELNVTPSSSTEGEGEEDDDPNASLEADPETVAELLGHNSLSLLWTLVISEFALTIPHGATSISHVLKAEFRAAHDGKVMGSRTFAYDEAAIDGYVAEEMRWWRGDREAKGVDIEEAFKCRVCEFAVGCEWRKGKVDEAVRVSRERRTTGDVAWYKR